jgi:hypothetical protein
MPGTIADIDNLSALDSAHSLKTARASLELRRAYHVSQGPCFRTDAALFVALI